MDSLANDKSSTQNLDANKMVDVLKRLPNGWSMIETKNGFAIHDDDDEFVCEAESSSELNRMLLNEFELAQMFASMMYVLKTSEPAEA